MCRLLVNKSESEEIKICLGCKIAKCASGAAGRPRVNEKIIKEMFLQGEELQKILAISGASRASVFSVIRKVYGEITNGQRSS